MENGWKSGTVVPKCIIAPVRRCVPGCPWLCPSSSNGLTGTATWTAVTCSNTSTRILPPSPPWSGTGSATVLRSTAPRCRLCRASSLATWFTSSSRPTEVRLWYTPTATSSRVCPRMRCSVLPKSLWLCPSARMRPRLRVLWWGSSTEQRPTSQTSWTTFPTSSPMHLWRWRCLGRRT